MAIELLNIAAVAGAFVVVPTMLFAVSRIEAWLDRMQETSDPP